jgi:hypothetical protein
MSQHTEDELRAIIAEYEATKTSALAKRDAQLRDFHAAGWRPIDLQRITGYSRETIRQALHPEVRHAANTSRRKTTARPPADYVTYGDRKPYIVVDTLTALHGPTEPESTDRGVGFGRVDLHDRSVAMVEGWIGWWASDFRRRR